MKHISCPGCSDNRTVEFYNVLNAPVHSIVTVTDRKKAMNIPRKEITLAICKGCGLIYNSSFDTKTDYHSQPFEDQQGFSPTFTKFITSIAQSFIDKYNIYNKKIIEIGCGKGDFLLLISKLGNNIGIGIDPAYVEGRIPPNENLSFLKEFYQEKHGKLPVDAIVCRHTLEHIHDVGNFLNTLHRSLSQKEHVVLLFEVPSVVRILEEMAFWDIYYEHCTYLSPGSMARLFRLHGFEILNLSLQYNNQYLFLEAKPGHMNHEKANQLEEDTSELLELAMNFNREVSRIFSYWRSLLLQYKVEGKKVVLWGGGSKSVGFLTEFSNLNLIEYVIDINPHLAGNFIPGIGLQYQQPEFLSEYRPDVVIIMNSVYEKEISLTLNSMGIEPILHSL